MQIAAAVTQQFSTRWFHADAQSSARATDQINDVAADFGVVASDVTFGPAYLESNPPQGDVTGNLTGPRGAVEAAAAAIDALNLGL